MRPFMIIAFASMLFMSAWANSMDSADAGQSGTPTETQPGY